MKQYIHISLICMTALAFNGCKEEKENQTEDFNYREAGLFICNEGQFQFGNGSLSFYVPENNEIQNEVFQRANGYKPGDMIQSMTIAGNRGWIVVNNSGVIFAIDPVTFKEKGRITGLTSPRYIHFVSNDKAYVSQLYDNRIAIIDPNRYEITGYIDVPDMTAENGSTEQMVQYNDYVYCNCWSYQNRIIRIDTKTDRVVDDLEVGIQPNSIVLDRNHKLWTITDGGYEGSPYGYETPRLQRIDPETFKVEKEFTFALGDYPTELQLNGDGTSLFWLNVDVWEMDINSDNLPADPVLNSNGTYYYGLSIDPEHGDIYVADAIDYQQSGMIYRYNSTGELVNKFYVGVNPGAFCWKPASR